jgi:hypothetical protein
LQFVHLRFADVVVDVAVVVPAAAVYVVVAAPAVVRHLQFVNVIVVVVDAANVVVVGL